MALAVMVGVPTALGQHLYDLGAIGPTGLQDPHKVLQPYLVRLAKDGRLAGGTASSGNAFLWTPAGGVVSIGAGGYNLVGVDWYTNGSTTVLAIANNWVNSTTNHPWYWQGNANGSGGTWTQLPGANAIPRRNTGFWFATGLGVATDNSDWWVSGYTTNTPTSGCTSPSALNQVGYQGVDGPTNAVITLFSTGGNGFHPHGAYYCVSSTGLFVGSEEYSGAGCPGQGSWRQGQYWQWQPADSGSTTIPMGPPEAGDGTEVNDSSKCVGLAVSGDGAIKGGCDVTGSSWRALWWDGSGYVHELPLLSYVRDGTLYTTDWMEIHSLNQDGSVMAGYYYTDSDAIPSDTQYEAFICFDSGNTVERLADYFAAMGLDTTGWVFSDVTALSSDGNVLAGWGTNSGVVHGWVAQLPALVVHITYTSLDGSGNVLINFATSRTADDTTSFAVQHCATVNGTYTDVSAAPIITGSFPSFQATVAQNGLVRQFYRIRHL
jgi:hypothetical protein